MIRSLAVTALLALPAVASAQIGSAVVIGPPIIGGRQVIGPPIGSGSATLYPVVTPTRPRFSVGGGSLSGPPQILVPSGSWGGVIYPPPVHPVLVPPTVAPLPANRSTTVHIGSGGPFAVRTAALTVQLPTAAPLWVGQTRVVGEPPRGPCSTVQSRPVPGSMAAP